MKSPHILLLNKNVGELKKELAQILSQAGAKSFDREVAANVRQLFSLGEDHFNFAKALQPIHWRQIISRSYYGAYNVSKAVRLAVHGQYSRETKDHDKVGELPGDFPDASTYANRLRLLRDDRNLCDYDHSVVEADLGINRAAALTLVGTFVADARDYLRGRKFRV